MVTIYPQSIVGMIRKYGLEQHQTDYFIYNNKYSREQAATLNKEVVAPNNFGAMALEHANIKVTPYYALLTEVSNHLPALTIDPTESLSNRLMETGLCYRG